MKDPANYGQSTRIEKLEARVKELEEALVHSIGKRMKSEKDREIKLPEIGKITQSALYGFPLFVCSEWEKRMFDWDYRPVIKKTLTDIRNKSDYPKPIEEPIAPRAFEGPYSLNIYKPEHEEWFTSGITCSTGAMDTAKELSKNSKVIVRVRDKKGALVTEFKP